MIVEKPPIDELQLALKDLESVPSPSYDQIKRFMTIVRESHARLPEQVYAYGSQTLHRFTGRLNLDEQWQLKEDVAVAALDLGHYDVAWALIDEIRKQFPDTLRTSRLLGMHLESTNNFDQAELLYKAELEKNPTNPTILKRMASMKKSQGNLQGAIESLKSYLEIHLADGAAWIELGELYIQSGAYSQAIFSLEEGLLHQPGNVSLLLLLAETLYTAGGAVNVQSARSYFSAVLEVSNGNNTRALYGVINCTAKLNDIAAAGGKGGASKGSDGDELATAAKEVLLQRYAIECPENLDIVKSILY